MKDKFQDSPVEIDRMLNNLLSLDVPGVTKHQVSVCVEEVLVKVLECSRIQVN